MTLPTRFLYAVPRDSSPASVALLDEVVAWLAARSISLSPSSDGATFYSAAVAEQDVPAPLLGTYRSQVASPLRIVTGHVMVFESPIELGTAPTPRRPLFSLRSTIPQRPSSITEPAPVRSCKPFALA